MFRKKGHLYLVEAVRNCRKSNGLSGKEGGHVSKMTMKEASEQYKIPIKILKEYEKWELCGAVKKVMGAWQYDDQDIERLSMIMTLHDMGFNSSEVETYMRLSLEGDHTEPERIAMLNRRRGKTLDEIHFKEKQIAHMDYLRYEMQKSKKE